MRKLSLVILGWLVAWALIPAVPSFSLGKWLAPDQAMMTSISKPLLPS